MPANDNNYRKIISGKDIGGQGLMMPNIGPGNSRSVTKQAAQSMMHGSAAMTPVQQINKKMSGIISGSPEGFPGMASSPQVIPAEVLQAAAMSGGGPQGRRNIKIRAVQQT